MRDLSKRFSFACSIAKRTRYRDELADATLERRSRKGSDGLDLATAPLLIVDDLGMRKLPTTAAQGPAQG